VHMYPTALLVCATQSGNPNFNLKNRSLWRVYVFLCSWSRLILIRPLFEVKIGVARSLWWEWSWH
jgi:hypothetical protein